MSVHDEVRGGVCAKASCRNTALMRAIERRERQARKARAKALGTALGFACGRGSSTTAVVVPFNGQPVVRLPRRRIQDFQAALTEIAKAVAESKPKPAACGLRRTKKQAAARFPEEPAVMRAGCATCQGHCCRQGAAQNAFIDAETIRRHMASRPRAGPAGIVRDYVDRIPAQTFRDSCVYHGATGCALPRSMRASICNTYHCDGLRDLGRVAARAAGRVILIVAAVEGEACRWTQYGATTLSAEKCITGSGRLAAGD